MEHGALSSRGCLGADMVIPDMVSFPAWAGAKDDEIVVFAWIIRESREKRDETNARVMADPRMKDFCDPENMPFDCKRMACAGFKTIFKA